MIYNINDPDIVIKKSVTIAIQEKIKSNNNSEVVARLRRQANIQRIFGKHSK